MSDNERVEKLANVLSECLAKLDEMQAHVAAAHLESALQALRRQFAMPANVSDPE